MSYTRLKVRNNFHIAYTRKHFWYSVPYALIGRREDVIFTDTTVQIYHCQRLVGNHMLLRLEHFSAPEPLTCPAAMSTG